MVSELMAVDPGNVVGIAGFENHRLSWAAARKWDPGLLRGLPYGWGLVVIEKPQVYKIEHSKGDPNDLIDLALKVGQLMAWYPNHELVLPRQWKGQLTKTQTWNRALEVLTPQELSIIKGNDHNMRDAICLGLWRLGRLKLA